MFIGIAAIPLLIDDMGLERFGMLSIAWMLVGYFGLLDMGMGRALTQKIADRIGGENVADLKPLIWKTLGLVGLLGLLGGLALTLMSTCLVYDLFNISDNYQQEIVLGIYCLEITISFVIVSTGLLGVLEGQQYFGWTAIVMAPLGILMFLAPLITLQ